MEDRLGENVYNKRVDVLDRPLKSLTELSFWYIVKNLD